MTVENMLVERPLVSIIIPFFNAESTIERAVDSCLNQTYSGFELILIDDHSTDASCFLARKYLSVFDDLKIIEMSSNKGSSAARNRGILESKGSLLAFLDADDYWHPRKLEIMIEVIGRNQDFNVFFHDTVVDPASMVVDSDISYSILSYCELLFRNPAHTPAVMVKNNGRDNFREDMRYSEDYDYWLRAAYPKGMVQVRLDLAALGRKVGSEGGVSANRWFMRLGEIKAYCNLYKVSSKLVFVSPILVVWSLLKLIRSFFIIK